MFFLNRTNRISKTLNINISLLVIFVLHSASRYVHLVDANNFESRSVEKYIKYSTLPIRRALGQKFFLEENIVKKQSRSFFFISTDIGSVVSPKRDDDHAK